MAPRIIVVKNSEDGESGLFLFHSGQYVQVYRTLQRATSPSARFTMAAPTLIWFLPLAVMAPLSAAAEAASVPGQDQKAVLKGRQFSSGGNGLGRGLDPEFMPKINMTEHEGVAKSQQSGSFFDRLGVPDLFRPLPGLKPDEKRRSRMATRDATARAAQTTPLPSLDPASGKAFDEDVGLRGLQRHSHRIRPQLIPSPTATPTTVTCIHGPDAKPRCPTAF